MYYIFQSTVGKVMFLIHNSHPLFNNFSRGKRFIAKGTKTECVDILGNLYPANPINELK
jgi:hypothetical protein